MCTFLDNFQPRNETSEYMKYRLKEAKLLLLKVLKYLRDSLDYFNLLSSLEGMEFWVSITWSKYI